MVDLTMISQRKGTSDPCAKCPLHPRAGDPSSGQLIPATLLAQPSVCAVCIALFSTSLAHLVNNRRSRPTHHPSDHPTLTFCLQGPVRCWRSMTSSCINVSTWAVGTDLIDTAHNVLSNGGSAWRLCGCVFMRTHLLARCHGGVATAPSGGTRGDGHGRPCRANRRLWRLWISPDDWIWPWTKFELTIWPSWARRYVSDHCWQNCVLRPPTGVLCG